MPKYPKLGFVFIIPDIPFNPPSGLTAMAMKISAIFIAKPEGTGLREAKASIVLRLVKKNHKVISTILRGHKAILNQA
jgi:hypothetical protein